MNPTRLAILGLFILFLETFSYHTGYQRGIAEILPVIGFGFDKCLKVLTWEKK